MRSVRIALMALVAAGCVAQYLRWREHGVRLHTFSLYRPGAATPFAVFKHRLAFAPLVPPIAAGERFYFIGAKDGECSAYSNRSDPITIFSLDPSTQEVIELPSNGAPVARIAPRIIPADDGFVLLGGGRSAWSSDYCDPPSELPLTLVFWAYQTFPLERIFSSGNLIGLLLRVGILKNAVDHGLLPVHESYRYRLSVHEWQRAPSLDLTDDEEPVDDHTSTSSVIVNDHYLLIASEDFESLQWVEQKSGARLPLTLTPHSVGFEFASISTAALVYSVEELDRR